jgi:hypothetical protein
MKGNDMNKTIAIVAVAAALGLGGLAVAQTDAAPGAGDPNRPWTLAPEATPSRGDRIPLADIEAQLRSEGLDVREIEWDDGKVEVEARDQAGRWWDIDLDAYTGDVIRSEQDDD